ncbi:efflux RND transporter periplasmic adaptor subunit [Lacibacter sp.]|uniref:efflux RND transporter periplasmic adaptor subunit n=1 Tax=Lacibacter sp. TaxID=1915409 RepID=UPI002B4ABC95|nr:efflux RND transporter periplasmic adaptor subunit [Lacibacter sp.]HLP38170.1 efflux RND transporter periplasmic adaptor subunit [Lacibacter sp.]
MKRLLAAILLLAGFTACNNTATEDHAHAPDGSHPGEGGVQALSYTLYTTNSELFVEFKPLVVGQTSKFAAHLTKLGENFLPYTEGTVTVSLVVEGKGIRQTATAPSSPGIFRLALQPASAGMGKLLVDIKTKDFTDQFIIDSVPVYADEKTALAAQSADAAGSDISYLKEQAWKIEFANAPVLKETIYDVVKATGEIQSAPGDEVTIAAKSNGIVKYAGNNNITGAAIRSGQTMFSITGGEIAFENVNAAKQTARAELATAKAEFERAGELIKDKLITQGEYRQAQLRYEQAQITLNNLGRNYSAAGKSLSSPINGFIKNILVSEGQYVSAGQPLAVITKNQRLLLKADVSLKDAEKISSIQEANFTIIQNKQTYNTKELNGKVLAVGKTTASNAPFIPVHFLIDGKPGMLAGSFAEVFLKTTPVADALVIPVSALVEEQGVFYVYVQTKGESFQKREVKLGANDGQKVQVLSGVAEAERVVIKGAYQIKLSQASGALPAHGHEH